MSQLGRNLPILDTLIQINECQQCRIQIRSGIKITRLAVNGRKGVIPDLMAKQFLNATDVPKVEVDEPLAKLLTEVIYIGLTQSLIANDSH